MTNNLATLEKAKKRVRMFYVIYWSCLAVILAIAWCIIKLGSGLYTPLLIAAIILYGRIAQIICFNKCIMSLIDGKLDPDTYLSAIRYGKLNSSAFTYQLYGERYCGNYRNVVSICNKKLSDPKAFKKYAFSYYTYLAKIKFDIGDDDNLRLVYDKYEQFLASKGQRLQKKMRKRTGIMEFFGAYLAGDYNKCIQIADKPTNSNLVKHTRIFLKAKISLTQGEHDKARELFESLATDVPQLNIGKISAQILVNMDNQKENPEKLELMSEAFGECDNAVIYPTRWFGWNVIAWCLLAFAMLGSLWLVFFHVNAENRYNAQMAVFREDIRVLVEEDHDGVEVLDVFTLVNGDETIDEMFICKTDSHIMAGAIFTYEGQEDEMFYGIQTRVPLKSMSSGRTTLLRFSFPAEITEHQVYGYFYLGETDLPEEYIQMSSFEVDGQKVYFVVTEIYDK